MYTYVHICIYIPTPNVYYLYAVATLRRYSSPQKAVFKRIESSYEACDKHCSACRMHASASWKHNCALAMCTCVAVCCSVLQCVAMCCSWLQCVAVSCSVLQCVAACCRQAAGKIIVRWPCAPLLQCYIVLQCVVSVYCSVLQSARKTGKKFKFSFGFSIKLGPLDSGFVCGRVCTHVSVNSGRARLIAAHGNTQ